MAATLKDVALKAGVSTATVSRVLNGGYYVSDQIRERVVQAVYDLGYQPNAVARSLRTSKTQIIGVIIPDMSNPYYMSLIRSIENVVRAHHYHLLISSSDDDARKEEEYLEIFLEKRVDGLVIAPCRERFGESMYKTAFGNTPTVFVDGYAVDVDVDTVTEESENSSYQLIQHVISLGHRKIAIVNSGLQISTSIDRQRGYERALTEVGIPLRAEYMLRGKYDQDTGYFSGKRLLGLGADRPTAVFATNNYIAVGLLLAIREAGMRVPEDISVVSFGELLIPQLISPSITAVIQNPEKVGEMAGNLLVNRLQNNVADTFGKIVLPTTLKLGSSVNPLKVLSDI